MQGLTPERRAQLERLMSEGKLDQAWTIAQRWAASHARDAELQLMLSLLALRQGKLPQAEFYSTRAAAIAPTHAGVLVQHARVLGAIGKQEAALEAIERALRGGDGGFADVHLTHAQTLLRLGRFAGARDACLRAIAIDGADVPARVTLANANLDCGRVEEAVDGLRRLMLESGDDPRICDILCSALNYDARAEPEFTRRIHLAYGRILARHRPDAMKPPHGRSRDASRSLRVGIVSPDLRAHSCAWFIEPFIEHHDRRAIELHLYHTNHAVDGVTERLRSHAAVFRHEWKTNDQSLAERIRDDAIDVAIDLSGHTRGQSLVAFHLRPAPVQVSYLGYPNITGLDAIDARIVDSITDPASDDDASRVSERLVRIDPCFLCFRIPGDAPSCVPEEVDEPHRSTWTPCGGGAVTFGSCNAIQKINASVMRTWAKVLELVPQSRLLLKATNLQEPALRDDVLRRFESAGVEPGRVEISPPVMGLAAHLAFYRRIDVALDSFPYCGTTTTCDAMLMGVPVVTLRGRVHASRVGASLATAVGHPEWIAEDGASYASKAARLAADVAVRAALRRELRERMRASPLCDGPAFARRVEDAIREAWRRWCES